MGSFNFGNDVIEAFRAGQQLKMQREQLARDEEERKLRLQNLKMQQDQIKHEMAVNKFKALHGTQGPITPGLPGSERTPQGAMAGDIQIQASPLPALQPQEESHPSVPLPDGGSLQPLNRSESLAQVLQEYALKQQIDESAKPEYDYGANMGIYSKRTGEVKTPAPPKKDTEGPTSVREYLYYSQQERAAGRTPASYNEFLTMDANRKRPITNIITETEKLLSPSEAAMLGVPYGTKRGEAKGELPANESQRATANYASRTRQAGDIINNVEGDIAAMGAVRQAYDKYAPNILQSDIGRNFMQAKRNFINAVLRRESGAVIAASEFEEGDRQYFPQPGDDAGTLTQKRLNRELVIAQLKQASGNAYIDPGTLTDPNISKPNTGNARQVRFKVQNGRLVPE